MKPSPHRRQRGFSTLEALIAFAVLALGMVALARLHVDLRAGAENARERSEALRLAQQDIETLRAFASPAGWTAIANADPADVTPVGGTTRYLRERSVVGDAAIGLKSVLVTLRWTDRQGAPQTLSLQTLLLGDDPALSGALALPRPAL
jgi:Tfp pilus assembly protein PilV